jgi:hypothetical protein
MGDGEIRRILTFPSTFEKSTIIYPFFHPSKNPINVIT